MKVRITKKGLYGTEGPISVGKVVELDEEPVAWTGHYELVDSGDPEPAAVPHEEQTRKQRLATIAEQLTEDDFTSDGKPDVKLINELLDGNEENFSAAERDTLWAEIQADKE